MSELRSSEGKGNAFWAVSICVAWASCSLAPLVKYLGYRRAAIVACLVIFAILVGLHLVKLCICNDRILSAKWVAAVYLLFTMAFVILYPYLQKHTLNSGSDREDALRIELAAVSHHQYPYDAKTFLGNPPTPLPGAMLLASPFYIMGHIAWQNLVWLALFLVCLMYLFRNRATGIFFVIVFLAMSPSNLNDFMNGGDYLANFFYFTAAIALFVRMLHYPLAYSLLAAFLLGLALSSRSIYFVAIVPMISLMLQRISKRKTLLLTVAIITTSSLITLPLFFPHPLPRLIAQISQGSDKLIYLPVALHLQWTLPLLALLTAFSSFFIRMSVRRLFLMFAASSCIVILPPVISSALHTHALPYECSYLAICALPYAFWALSRYEEQVLPYTRQSRDNWLTTV